MSKQQSTVQIYISGNFVDEDGVGHHGEMLEVNEYMANKLIEGKNAILLEDHLQLEKEKAERVKAQQEENVRPEKTFRVISAPKATRADAAPGSNMV